MIWMGNLNLLELTYGDVGVGGVDGDVVHAGGHHVGGYEHRCGGEDEFGIDYQEDAVDGPPSGNPSARVRRRVAELTGAATAALAAGPMNVDGGDDAL